MRMLLLLTVCVASLLFGTVPAPGASLSLGTDHAAPYAEGGGPLARDSRFSDRLKVHSASVMSGDLISATPEPLSLLLFGAALAGVGLLLRRHLRRARRLGRT